MSQSMTSRSLEWLRDRGWQVEKVEKRDPYTKKLKDCFGADIIAIHRAQKQTLWVQATSGSNHGARVKKSSENPEVLGVLSVGHLFEVWSWSKKKDEWVLRRESIQISSFQNRVSE